MKNKYNLLFQAILLISGFIIIGINAGWWAAIGVFLFVWGNNIQISNDCKEFFKKQKESKDDE